MNHPCKDTCSGYSQDCAEQIATLQARVKELEHSGDMWMIKCCSAEIENTTLRKVVDAARDCRDDTEEELSHHPEWQALSKALRELDWEKADYYYYKGTAGTKYTDNDPEVTCRSCSKTFRTDMFDRTCRLCRKEL